LEREIAFLRKAHEVASLQFVDSPVPCTTAGDTKLEDLDNLFKITLYYVALQLLTIVICNIITGKPP
jgi:hypothetical protein